MSTHNLGAELIVLRKLRGIAISIIFMAVALLAIEYPNVGTVYVLESLGVSKYALTLWFGISSIAILITAMKGLRWNYLWFAVLHFYTGATWLALLRYDTVPTPITPVFYTALSIITILDCMESEYGR